MPFLENEKIAKEVKCIDEILKSSPEPQFHPNLVQNIIWLIGLKFIQMNGPTLFQGENITRFFFSRITGPISTILGTKYPMVKRIQVCSNVGPPPFPRADNYEMAKKDLTEFKDFF